jgi:hypothetical protein
MLALADFGRWLTPQNLILAGAALSSSFLSTACQMMGPSASHNWCTS